MSSDLLEDVEDRDGTAVFLSMEVSGDAQLILMGADRYAEGGLVSFNLTPDEEGLKKAEAIEKALAAWRAQVGRIKP